MAARRLFSTKDFIWLHVPKTGGTWLHQVLTKYAPESWEVCGGPPAHVRLYEVPTALEHWNRRPDRIGLPIIASVRNPWDWYVSLYFFLEQHRVNRTGGYSLPKNQWQPGLAQWEERYGKGNNVRGFRAAMPRILEDMHVKAVMGIANPQTYFVRDPYGSVGVRAVRFEGLRKNMLEALEAVGAEVSPTLRDQLTNSPKANTSGHAKYTACYDDATRKLVARHEAWMIDRFGYRFGD